MKITTAIKLFNLFNQLCNEQGVNIIQGEDGDYLGELHKDSLARIETEYKIPIGDIGAGCVYIDWKKAVVIRSVFVCFAGKFFEVIAARLEYHVN